MKHENNFDQSGSNFQSNNNISGNVQNMNQQLFGKKTPKKFNFGLIAGVALAGVAGIAAGAYLLLSNGGNDKNLDDGINENLTGTVKFIKESNNPISTYISNDGTDLTHFKLKDDKGEFIIDCNGNTVVDTENYSTFISYLGDNYYATKDNSNKISIIKNNKVVFTYTNHEYDYYFMYKDGILYYSNSIDNTAYVIAQELGSGKELWKINGKSPMLLENGFIAVERGKLFDILNSNGQIVASSVYPTSSDYYFKVTEDLAVDVYDYHNSKISSLSLEKNGTVSYEFITMFSNGMYVVSEFDSSNWVKTYKVYNKDSNVVTELLDCDYLNGNSFTASYYTGHMVVDYLSDASKSILSDVAYGKVNSYEKLDFIIYADGSIDKMIGLKTNDGDLDTLGSTTLTNKHYVIGVDPDGGVKVVNLDNKKSKTTIGQGWTTYRFGESPNGKYVVLNIDNSTNRKYVLDENLETIYDTDNQLRVVNDQYVIEYSLSAKDQIYLVNVFTKEKKLLDTTGTYYSNNAAGLITVNNGTYYLYSFN